MQELFSTNTFATRNNEPRFLLNSITVYNWGPFAGMQAPAEIHPDGSAIVGSTGSGKTTLIDALMTLLVANPDYNLASTGGHDKNDRSIVSYVRGIKGMTSSSGENDNILRPGNTCTGISATYSDGKHSIKIGAIFFFKSHSNSTSDLERLYFAIQDHKDDLTDLLSIFDQGGKSAIKRYAKEHSHIETYDSKKSYLAMLRRFFEVGDNAFNLLNRAAGLKQLNSINQIFRELVLDNKPMFDRALKVAESFDNLEIIHNELLNSKKQLEALLPIEKEHKKWEKQRQQEHALKSLRSTIPVWLAQKEITLWDQIITSQQDQLITLQASLSENQHKETTTEQLAQTIQTKYMEQGGAVIEEIKTNIQREKASLELIQKSLNQYNKIASKLGISSITNTESFEQNRSTILAQADATRIEKEQLDEQRIQLRAQSVHLIEQYSQLNNEKKEVSQRPKSNIPSHCQHFREQLASALNLSNTDLPFAAEMIEVKPDQRNWTGAIERAIGSERLRLLVPEFSFAQARDWVNNRDNKVHVRLLNIGKAHHSSSPYKDSFIHKLNLEQSDQYTIALNDLLKRKDRHCVESPDQLDQQEFSMTIQGLMYDKQGRFEKQDQRPLNKDWMTGFDNSFLLESINEQLSAIELQLQAPKEQEKQLTKAISNCESTLTDLNRLLDFNFERIDVFSKQQTLENEQQKLAQLESPNSDLAQLRSRYEQLKSELTTIRERLSSLNHQIGGVESKLSEATQKTNILHELASSPLDPHQSEALTKRFPKAALITLLNVEKSRQAYTNSIQQDIDEVAEKIKVTQTNLGRFMEKAKIPDTGDLIEADTQLIDIPTYLDRLEFLRKEDLPQRKKRFLQYLNESSDQGVTQLLEKIHNEVSQIKDRLEKLNATLGKVEYKAGKFLMLDASEISNDGLKELRIAEKKLVTARLSQSDDDGERRYKALKDMVQIIRDAGLNRRKLSSQALLDPRYRLEFFVREVERESGKMSDKISGSQTGSGGEKEQMASYILTASLSYALCPKGASRPKYATIVLDEAFSKSSQSAASKIIQALREFGLHPLFVTPNKEMSLLKANTSSAILVHQARLCSLSWTELDQMQTKQMLKNN
ncbi:hypothetical protein OAB00_01060 [Akkermansiaceae bacterium]|nr:hypothetical protein [Akkermansiaceae bacterium]